MSLKANSGFLDCFAPLAKTEDGRTMDAGLLRKLAKTEDDWLRELPLPSLRAFSEAVQSFFSY